MKDSPAFIATATEHVFEMAYNCVYFAHKHLAGEKVPYLVITPGIGLTREMLLNTKPPKGINLWDYDLPGVMKKFGWKRSFQSKQFNRSQTVCSWKSYFYCLKDIAAVATAFTEDD